MITNNKQPANAKKIAQLETALAELVSGSLRRGFHGKLSIEWKVQDGTVQQIVRRIERTER